MYLKTIHKRRGPSKGETVRFMKFIVDENKWLYVEFLNDHFRRSGLRKTTGDKPYDSKEITAEEFGKAVGHIPGLISNLMDIDV